MASWPGVELQCTDELHIHEMFHLSNGELFPEVVLLSILSSVCRRSRKLVPETFGPAGASPPKHLGKVDEELIRTKGERHVSSRAQVVHQCYVGGTSPTAHVRHRPAGGKTVENISLPKPVRVNPNDVPYSVKPTEHFRTRRNFFPSCEAVERCNRHRRLGLAKRD